MYDDVEINSKLSCPRRYRVIAKNVIKNTPDSLIHTGLTRHYMGSLRRLISRTPLLHVIGIVAFTVHKLHVRSSVVRLRFGLFTHHPPPCLLDYIEWCILHHQVDG